MTECEKSRFVCWLDKPDGDYESAVCLVCQAAVRIAMQGGRAVMTNEMCVGHRKKCMQVWLLTVKSALEREGRV